MEEIMNGSISAYARRRRAAIRSLSTTAAIEKLECRRLLAANGALQFNGSSTYVSAGDPANNSLDVGANATFETWVKFTAAPAAGSLSTFISKDIGPGDVNKWFFAYSENYGSPGIGNGTVF